MLSFGLLSFLSALLCLGFGCGLVGHVITAREVGLGVPVLGDVFLNVVHTGIKLFDLAVNIEAEWGFYCDLHFLLLEKEKAHPEG